MKDRNPWVLCLCTLIVVPSVAKGAVSVEVRAPGETTVRLASPEKVTVTLETVMLSRQAPGALPPEIFGNLQQLAVVKRMRIRVGKRTVGVPRSTFLDVVNPRTVSLATRAGEFELTLDHGDASESGRVVVYFDDQKVRRRLRYTGTGELLEEDYYHPVVIQ